MSSGNRIISDVTVRRATLEDRDILGNICRDSFPLSLRWQSAHILGKKWLNVALVSPSVEVWVCSYQDQVAGFVVLTIDENGWAKETTDRVGSRLQRSFSLIGCPKLIVRLIKNKICQLSTSTKIVTRSNNLNPIPDKCSCIHLIAVSPKSRGLGLAKHLIKYCENRSCELHKEAIKLCVEPENNPAISLYENLGFKCHKNVKAGYLYIKMINNNPSRVKCES